jgi:hypothetical protein
MQSVTRVFTYKIREKRSLVMKQMKNKIHRKDQRNVLTRIRIVIKRRGPDQTTEMKRPWGSK